MGLDFRKKTAASFRRATEKGYGALTEPDLYQQDPELKPRTLVLRPRQGETLAPGQQLLGKREGDRIVAYRVNKPVGDIQQLSLEEQVALARAGDYCEVTVERVSPISGSADVALK